MWKTTVKLVLRQVVELKDKANQTNNRRPWRVETEQGTEQANFKGSPAQRPRWQPPHCKSKPAVTTYEQFVKVSCQEKFPKASRGDSVRPLLHWTPAQSHLTLDTHRFSQGLVALPSSPQVVLMSQERWELPCCHQLPLPLANNPHPGLSLCARESRRSYRMTATKNHKTSTWAMWVLSRTTAGKTEFKSLRWQPFPLQWRVPTAWNLHVSSSEPSKIWGFHGQTILTWVHFTKMVTTPTASWPLPLHHHHKSYELEGITTLETYMKLCKAADFCLVVAKEAAQSMVSIWHLWVNLPQMLQEQDMKGQHNVLDKTSSLFGPIVDSISNSIAIPHAITSCPAGLALHSMSPAKIPASLPATGLLTDAPPAPQHSFRECTANSEAEDSSSAREGRHLPNVRRGDELRLSFKACPHFQKDSCSLRPVLGLRTINKPIWRIPPWMLTPAICAEVQGIFEVCFSEKGLQVLSFPPGLTFAPKTLSVLEDVISRWPSCDAKFQGSWLLLKHTYHPFTSSC